MGSSVACVITAGADRVDNLKRTLALAEQTAAQEVVVVLDGPEAWPIAEELHWSSATIVFNQKHEPGKEQPRNIGARNIDSDADLIWFLDSDLVFEPQIVDVFLHAYSQGPPRILIGPYDWGSPGHTELGGTLEMADPRNAAFELYDEWDVISEGSGSSRGEILGTGLACFGGNLVWPKRLFEEIGGFHPDLHHGRCEDGELGLRAVEHGIPMSYVKAARAYHVWHPRNEQWICKANEIDVPKLNRLHPWVQNDGLRVVPEDGLRFNFICPVCEESVNTGLYWSHYEQH